MVAILTAALMSAAEIFNIFAVLLVLLIFMFMTNFILRLTPDDIFGTSVVHVGYPTKVKISVQKVEVPFTLLLCNPKSASCEEIKLKIRNNVPCFVHAFWGLSVSYLNNMMSLPWASFQQQLMDQQLQKHYVRSIDAVSKRDDEIIELFNKDGLSLGPPTRQCFPLVIILRKKDSSENEVTSDVGAYISIIHIKDEYMDLNTCILHQYLKQYSGQLSMLTSLYSEGVIDDGNTTVSDDVPLEEACVVCQVNRVSRALLPCRHLCICGVCFNQLETCPMCRTRIQSYFTTTHEDYVITDESTSNTNSIRSKFESLWREWFY